MHIGHALALATAGLLLTSITPAPAARADGTPGRLSVDPVARIGGEGRVTVSGTYRCPDDGTGAPVLVGARIAGTGYRTGAGGAKAVCDGRTHRWRSRAQPAAVLFGPGRVTVAASLARSATGAEGIRQPRVLAVRRQLVDLVPERR